MNAPVTAVTILEDRASVTRRATGSLAAGQHRITIESVSPILVDKTLNATATGARVLDARCERYIAPWRDPESGKGATTIEQLRAERHRLEATRGAADAQLQSANVEIDAIAQMLDAALEDLSVAATRGTKIDGANQVLAELDTQHAAARARRVAAQLEKETVERQLARLAARIQRAEREAGDDAARIVVDLIVDAATEVELVVGYVVPGAAWRPYHRAVLDRSAGRVEWQTTACVWQATGEDWTDVALTFSLERPSLGVEPPELDDDVLATRRKPDQVTVQVREQVQQETGLGGGAAQVPGIDDGGLGITLAAPKATVRADGMPHRIAVGGFTSSAELALVAIPLRSAWVHVRARLANTGTVPLLAGPVDLVMSSGYVGRADVGFVAPNEKFDLGFGPEADIRAHRSETRDRDDAGLLGGWNVQTIKVAIRLSNLGATPRAVTVTERVPISEVEQVEIVVGEPDAYRLDQDEPRGESIPQVTARKLDDKGMVTWDVELPPHGRRAVALLYKVRSQRGVAGI